MAKILDILLIEDGAYWPPTNSNKFGEVGVGTPVQIRCKHNSSRQEQVTKEGKTYVSNGTIYTDTEIIEGGWVWIGTYADKPNVPLEILRNVTKTSDPDNEETLYVGTY